MNILGFKINGLFGTLEHTIEFKEGGLTFIHGPNGSGKTTALKLLELALTCNLTSMRDIIFSSMEIDFSDKYTIIITRLIDRNERADSTDEDYDDETSPGERVEIQISLQKGKKVIEPPISTFDAMSVSEIKAQVFQRPMTAERLSAGMLTRVGSRTWRLAGRNEPLGLQEVADYLVQAHIRKAIPSWYLKRTQSIKLASIRAQRLYDFNDINDTASDRSTDVRQIVSVFSEDIVKRINETISRSTLQFQKKEKTFPHRILAGDVKAETEATLRASYIELQKRISTLSDIGLQESSDSITLPAIKLNPTHKRVLTLYLADMNEKLDIFNEIFEQISLMSALLNNKLRRKKFSINKQEGFLLRSVTDDGSSLKPTDLSSGEQHQLVILYKLIFSDEPNQIYLIDEPEISLHVEWQRQFSDDLKRIAESRGHQFVIATHSPQIINGRLDLAIPLDGGIPNEQ